MLAASVFICVFTHLSVAAHSVGISGEGCAGNRILIFKMFHCTWEHFDVTNGSRTQTTAILGHWRRRRMLSSERSCSTVTEVICLSVSSAEAVVGCRSNSVAMRTSEPTAASAKFHKVMSYSK